MNTILLDKQSIEKTEPQSKSNIPLISTEEKIRTFANLLIDHFLENQTKNISPAAQTKEDDSI